MQLETGKRDLSGILGEDQAAQLRTAVVLPVNAETVQVFAAPIEDELENLMELGDAGFACDQETPPDQGTHATEHDSQLIKFSHASRLPKPAPNFPTTTPRNLPLSKQGQFEVIAGKSILVFKRESEEKPELSSRCFAFVQTYDENPKRRLFELLQAHGREREIPGGKPHSDV